jgi:hypothetical protein
MARGIEGVWWGKFSGSGCGRDRGMGPEAVDGRRAADGYARALSAEMGMRIMGLAQDF